MKTLKTCIIALVLLSVITGCKKEDSKTSVPAAEEAAAEPAVQVVLDMVVKKDDTFEMFYVEDESLDFGDNKTRVKVKGKNESQEIVFNFPDNASIGNLRFDAGENPEQDEMTINKVIIKQKDKELELSAADFFTHFTASGYVKTFPEKFSFKGIKVNNVYDPMIYGNTTLMHILRELKK